MSVPTAERELGGGGVWTTSPGKMEEGFCDKCRPKGGRFFYKGIWYFSCLNSIEENFEAPPDQNPTWGKISGLKKKYYRISYHFFYSRSKKLQYEIPYQFLQFLNLLGFITNFCDFFLRISYQIFEENIQ